MVKEMNIENKINEMLESRKRLDAEYEERRQHVDMSILNEIDVEYGTVSARIERDRQTLLDLATLRNTTRTRLGLSEGDEQPKRKIVKMSSRQIANTPVENSVFMPRNASEAIRHLLAKGELPGRTIMKEMTEKWQYSENAFYATVATMVRSGEVETRKGAGVTKLYRLVMV